MTAERLAYGPEAVARLASGKAAFVAGAAPGDTVLVEVVAEHASFARARAVELIEPGPNRAEAPDCCAACGGCPWAHVAYAAQLEAKRASVVDGLARAGKVPRERAESLVGACIPSKRQWGYRNKVELAAALGPKGLEVGMHAPGSDRIVAIERCPLAYKAIERAPRALRGALRYALGGQDVGLFRIGVRHSVRTRETEVALWTRPGPFPRKEVAKTIGDACRASSIVRVLAEEGRARKVKKVEVLSGKGHWDEELAGNRYSVSAPSFFQVNTSQAEELVRLALEGMAPGEGSLVADLYAGVGAFALPLAQRGCDVMAVEAAGSSVRDLRRNAARAKVNVEVIGGDVARELPEVGGLDAAVVDPPRSGLAEGVPEAVAAAAPGALAYVSCDPQTWGRDAGRLEALGYRLASAVPVDMFPQTYHVEVVSIFVPSGALE